MSKKIKDDDPCIVGKLLLCSNHEMKSSVYGQTQYKMNEFGVIEDNNMVFDGSIKHAAYTLNAVINFKYI